MLEGLVGHHRTEIRSADTDVDDITNALTCVTFPCSTPHSIAEIGHLVEHNMHRRHHVLTIYNDGSSPRSAQGDMQHRPLFRNVDLLAPEHRIDSRLQAGFIGKLEKEFQGFVSDEILRIIQIDAESLSRQTLAAFRIIRKEFAEMRILDTLIVIFESFPGSSFDG